jgi:hypothetical protein
MWNLPQLEWQYWHSLCQDFQIFAYNIIVWHDSYKYISSAAASCLEDWRSGSNISCGTTRSKDWLDEG